MTESLVTEAVACVCGKGLICVDVHTGEAVEGVRYRIEDKPVPCPACGSVDIKTARAAQQKRDGA